MEDNIVKDYNYIYGPVPSRRMGLSLGISPLPKKTCNYSCIYCQLGRTNIMINERKEFYPIDDILFEIKNYIEEKIHFDVVTIVGEGEPTLFLELGKLIEGIKNFTNKPIAVITNGALLYDKKVQKDLFNADIVLPSVDFFDFDSFKKINRPHKNLSFEKVYKGIIDFSKNYKGNLWIETMLIKNFNDDEISLRKLEQFLKKINYDRLYINTPIRPPAENFVEAITSKKMEEATIILNGISIDQLVSKGFYSEIADDYKAILSIIKRHPMNQYEIKTFLSSRKCKTIEENINKLDEDELINCINYKGYKTYRLK